MLLNGDDVTGELSGNPSGALEGVISGMRLGANKVEVTPTQHSAGTPANATLRLTSYPITGPIFSGPHQYPFVCKTDRPANALGQPLVDNQDQQGFPVYAVDARTRAGRPRPPSRPTRSTGASPPPARRSPAVTTCGTAS